jgi:hypothetical protein
MNALDKIKQFLSKVSNITLGYNEVNFFSPETLQKEQVGYSIDPSGRTLVTGRAGDWKAEWLVIGRDPLGEPMIVDTASEELAVLSALHGEGVWTPFVIADSMESFGDVIAVLEGVSYGRSTPVDMEKNPIGKRERQFALEQIAGQNPHAELAYWEGFFEEY